MSRSVAPTELKYYVLLMFYKGNTPTELLAFSKQFRMDKAIIADDTSMKLFFITHEYSPPRWKKLEFGIYCSTKRILYITLWFVIPAKSGLDKF